MCQRNGMSNETGNFRGAGGGGLPFARKRKFSRCAVSGVPVVAFRVASLSRLEEKNHKSKWRLHLQCGKAGNEAEVNRVE